MCASLLDTILPIRRSVLFLIHFRTFRFNPHPPTAFSALRVFAITAGNRKLSLLVFVLGLVPVATNIVRLLLYP